MDVGQAWELLQTAGADALEVAQACEIVKSHAEARQLEALRQISQEDPAFIDPFGLYCDPAPAEIACALAWTPFTATRRLELAHELHEQLPELLDALRDGLIDIGKTQEIADGSRLLLPDTRAALVDRACNFAQSHTCGQLRAWLAKQVARLDPEAAQKRRKKAIKERGIWITPQTDGMASLGAYLTAEEAQACYNSLIAGAANHVGGIEAARADLFVERLTGITPGERIPVQVLITPSGPEIAGYGPISQAHANQLSEGFPKIRLERPAMTIGYRPGIDLVRYVKARDRRCRFRGCRRPAVHCDIDHLIAWPAGVSDERNLHCLCRYHHRLKTHTGWKVRLVDGQTEWTSPRGHKYRTKPDDP